MKSLLFRAAWAVLLALASPTWAQTVYHPVQFQYGRFGEIFYGGTNPRVLNDPCLLLPEVPRNVTATLPAPAVCSPALYPLTVRCGFAAPANRSTRYDATYPSGRPLLLTDFDPYRDAGTDGFTINDARNEAYWNVPRYQVGAAFRAPPAPAESAPPPAGSTGPAKAVPLLNWARAEAARARNPALLEALLQEAAKNDPAATARVRAEIKKSP